MSIICWTVFYPGSPSVSHRAVRLAHTAVRHVRPIVHHANLIQHHAAKVTAQANGWFKLVCKVIPAAVVGGGALLAPHPTTPPQLPAPPPAFAAPGPAVAPGSSPPIWNFRPQTPSIPYVGPFPPTMSAGGPRSAVPEPSSAAVLLAGFAGLLLLRLSIRGLAYSSGRIQPGASQTQLLRRGPVA
jgi:hypothetical protein